MEEVPEVALEGLVEEDLTRQEDVVPLTLEEVVPLEGQEVVEDLLTFTEDSVPLTPAEAAEGSEEGVDHPVLAEACSCQIGPQG